MNYTEMQKLRDLLDAEGIRWEDYSDPGTEKFRIVRTRFRIGKTLWSAVTGPFTYGGREGELELLDISKGFGREPIGFLTAESALEIAKERSQNG